MKDKIIYGIQQIGVGVDDADKAFKWYGTKLGADICVFDDNNTATYMAPYMGGKVREKRAIMAVNLQGGSGYEIWQHTGRTPSRLKESLNIGDLGINISKIKSNNINVSFNRLKSEGVEVLSEIETSPDGKKCFYINDLCGSTLQIIESENWYMSDGFDLGGTHGCIIGVSDIDSARKLYSEILGYKLVLSDTIGKFEDLKELPNGKSKFRRVILSKEKSTGGFAELFGESEIELIQAIDYTPKRIFDFKERFWGDIGFIQVW